MSDGMTDSRREEGAAVDFDTGIECLVKGLREYHDAVLGVPQVLASIGAEAPSAYTS